MGDDPFVPNLSTEAVAYDRGNSANATSGSIYNISNIGKPSLTILVVVAGLSLGLSIGAVAIALMNGNSASRDSARAEREARMAEYYIVRLDAYLVQEGLRKAGDDYQKFKSEQQAKEK